jgi:hypothetical protein
VTHPGRLEFSVRLFIIVVPRVGSARHLWRDVVLRSPPVVGQKIYGARGDDEDGARSENTIRLIGHEVADDVTCVFLDYDDHRGEDGDTWDELAIRYASWQEED